MDELRSLFDLDSLLDNIIRKHNSWDELVQETNNLVDEKLENAVAQVSIGQKRSQTFAIPKLPKYRIKNMRTSLAARKKSTRRRSSNQTETIAPEGNKRIKRSTRLASKQSQVNYIDETVTSSSDSEIGTKPVRQSSRAVAKICEVTAQVEKPELVAPSNVEHPVKAEPVTVPEAKPVATKRPTSSGKSQRTATTRTGVITSSDTPASKFKKLNIDHADDMEVLDYTAGGFANTGMPTSTPMSSFCDEGRIGRAMKTVYRIQSVFKNDVATPRVPDIKVSDSSNNVTFDVKRNSTEYNRKYVGGLKIEEKTLTSTPSKIPVSVNTPKRIGISTCRPESVKKIVRAFEREFMSSGECIQETVREKEDADRRETNTDYARSITASSSGMRPLKILLQKYNIAEGSDNKGEEKENKKNKREINDAATEAKRKREKGKWEVTAKRQAAEKGKMDAKLGKQKLDALKKAKQKEEKKKQMLSKEKAKKEVSRNKLLASQEAAETEMRCKQEAEARDAMTRKIDADTQSATANEDYGISDMSADDSSDDECRPKRSIPSWAERKNRCKHLINQNRIPKKFKYRWFFNSADLKPNIHELFSVTVTMRPRTSSIYWTSRLLDDTFGQ